MKKENMNNKGFSLVELIIVIAIMAILIVVLAPQYLKYVEKSRNSTDLQSATEFKSAIEIYAADPEATESFSTTAVDVVFTSTGVSAVVDSDPAIKAALANAALSKDKLKCMSKQKWDSFTLSLKAEDNGSITWTYKSSLKGEDNAKFSDAMNNKNTNASSD